MRKSRVVAIGIAVAACAALGTSIASAATSASAPSSPWTQTNGNAALDRANLSETTLTPGDVAQVKHRRSVVSPPPGQLGDENCFTPAADPVLTGGYLYAVVGNEVTKTNVKTGARVWTANPDPSETSVFFGLAVSNGIVVLDRADCISQSDPATTITAFDSSTGSTRWSRPEDEFNDTTMAVSGGYILLGSEEETGSVFGALKLSTGATAWTQSGCDAPYVVAVVDALAIHSGCDETTGEPNLQADRLATGAVVWTRSGAWTVQAGDVDTSAGQNVFVADGTGLVHDINPQNGHDRYTLAGAKTVIAVGPTRVFATCSTSSTCGYGLSSGARQWTNTAENPKLAALANGILFLSDGNAVRASTGAHLADVFGPATGSGVTALVVGDGHVAIIGDPQAIAIYGLPGS